MKDFSKYTSVMEVVQDLISEGVFPRNKKVRDLYPGLVVINLDRVAKFKIDIEAAIKNKNLDVTMSASRLARSVRSDNHPDEFKLAIKQLIEERKITEEKMVTGKIGRPFIHYNLFEF